MSYNRQNFMRIREEYNTKYLRARETADLRRSEIHRLIPEVEQIDRQMSETGMQIMKAAMESKDYEARLSELRKQNEALQTARKDLLLAAGYPADYTDVHYECPLCHDSGYVDCKMCRCMKQKLIEAAYESSGVSELLKTQSFDNFDLRYYEGNESQHRQMTLIFQMMKKYADTFTGENGDSLVLFGGTGLGKTHLSSAVAGTVIARGFDVYYTGAVGLFSDFEFQRFGNSSVAENSVDISRYYECDLLIIDDLGSELSNQFTTSVLYNIVNTRLNRRQSTIISTNLTVEEFRKRYWDRITSRVMGNYQVLPFVGTDIRQRRIKKP